jgi:hypothetical protein
LNRPGPLAYCSNCVQQPLALDVEPLSFASTVSVRIASSQLMSVVVPSGPAAMPIEYELPS